MTSLSYQIEDAYIRDEAMSSRLHAVCSTSRQDDERAPARVSNLARLSISIVHRQASFAHLSVEESQHS